MVIKEQVNDVIDWCKEAGVRIPKEFTELRNLTNYYRGAKNDGMAERCYKTVKRLLRQPNRENKKKVVDVIAVWTALKDMAPQKAVEESVGRQTLNSEERTYLLTGEGEEKIMAEQYNFAKPLQYLFDETRTVLQVRLETASEDQKVRINKQIEFITEQISELDKVNDVSSPKASDAAWGVYRAVEALRDSIKKKVYENVDNSVKGTVSAFDTIRKAVAAMVALKFPKKTEKVENPFHWEYGQDVTFIAELLVRDFRAKYDDLNVSIDETVRTLESNIDDCDNKIRTADESIAACDNEYDALEARHENGEISDADFDRRSNRIADKIEDYEADIDAESDTLNVLEENRKYIRDVKNTICKEIEKFLKVFSSSNVKIITIGQYILNTMDNIGKLVRGESIDKDQIQTSINYIASLVNQAQAEFNQVIDIVAEPVVNRVERTDRERQTTDRKPTENRMIIRRNRQRNAGSTVTNNVVDPTVTTVIKPVTNDTTNRDD